MAFDPCDQLLRVEGLCHIIVRTHRKPIVDLLMRNLGRIFPAEEIYARVWEQETAYAPENTVMVHIRRIPRATSS